MRNKKDKLDNLLRSYYGHKREIQKRDAAVREPKTDYLTAEPLPAGRAPSAGQKTAPPHPPLSVLGAYVDGTLDERGKAKIRGHIRNCPDCRDKVRSGVESIQEYTQGRLAKTDEKLSCEVSSRLESYCRKKRGHL